MSHHPTSEPVKAAFDALRRERTSFSTRIYELDTTLLRELLIAAACPVVCVGYINDEGWHNLCIRKADEAMAALGVVDA